MLTRFLNPASNGPMGSASAAVKSTSAEAMERVPSLYFKRQILKLFTLPFTVRGTRNKPSPWVPAGAVETAQAWQVFITIGTDGQPVHTASRQTCSLAQ